MTRLTPLTIRARRRVEVRDLIRTCTACPLHAHARPSPVPFEGPMTPRYVILGEAPGTTEQRRQRPFIGPSGSVLRRLIVRSGLDPKDGMWLNTVCCCPFGAPTHEAIAACRQHLDAQLELANPGAPLLAVGQVALDALFPGARITVLHGAGLLFGGPAGPRPVIPAYHPAYLLRDPTAKPAVVDAINRFRALVNGITPDFFRAPLCHLDKRKPQPAVAWDDRLLPYCESHEPEIRKAPGRAARRRTAANRARQTHMEMP